MQLVKSMSRLRGGGAGGGAVHRQDSSETTVSQSDNHTPEAFRNSEKKGETSFTKRNIKTQVSDTLLLLFLIGIYIYNFAGEKVQDGDESRENHRHYCGLLCTLLAPILQHLPDKVTPVIIRDSGAFLLQNN